VAWKDMTALVVDDFATMRRIIRNILRDLGFNEILEADEGEKALDILRRQKVDLVLADWNMPNMTGLELLKEVRATPGLSDLPFVLVTAEAQRENVIEAVKAKVSNYIVKPFNAATLADKLGRVLPDE
jgi:two-component system chemotaxis response regulator CheY